MECCINVINVVMCLTVMITSVMRSKMRRKRKDVENRLRISRREKQRVRSLRMMMIRGYRDSKVRDRHLLGDQTDLSPREDHHSRARDLLSKGRVHRVDLPSHRDHPSLVKTDLHHNNNKQETDPSQRKWTLMMTLLTLKVEHHLLTEVHPLKEKVLQEVKVPHHPKAKVPLPKVRPTKDRSQGESIARLSPS